VANLKPQNFLKRVLIGLAVLLVMALVSCGGSSSDETEPYIPKIGKAKLLAPKGSDARMVPAGITKGDLDQAFKAAMEPYFSVLRNGPTPTEVEKMRTGEAWNEWYKLAESGRIILILNGTECRVIEADSKYSKVKILNGPSHQFGKTFWVYSPTVVN